MKVCNHASRNRKFMRETNLFVQPSKEETELSTARIDVVPKYKYVSCVLLHHLQYHC
jgi:hypothetical protein